MEENKNMEAEVIETNTTEMENEVAEENTTTDEVVVETGEEKEETAAKKKAYRGMTATKNGLFLRGVIGAFIVYYGYTIFADIASTPADERTPLYVFIAVFGVAGFWIIIDSVKRLLKKEYED